MVSCAASQPSAPKHERNILAARPDDLASPPTRPLVLQGRCLELANAPAGATLTYLPELSPDLNFAR